MRLCSINIKPSKEDIVHGITYDPNINLDTPKDSAHCVMLYTVQRQLDMTSFFDYAIKRLEYIFYKIVRYSIWSIMSSPELPGECLALMEKEEFQQIFEIETYNYVTKLCSYTRQSLAANFDEIMNSPIVMSHTARYKEMLINDFNWTSEDIEACYDENIFKPKNIGVHNKDKISILEEEDGLRIEKIQNLIKLHIHVRLLMICEKMTMSIDYNWRRMLDDTKESTIREKNMFSENVFDHIRNNVCKTITINGNTYGNAFVKQLYSNTLNEKIYIDPVKISNIETFLENLTNQNSKIADVLENAVRIAGSKFL